MFIYGKRQDDRRLSFRSAEMDHMVDTKKAVRRSYAIEINDPVTNMTRDLFTVLPLRFVKVAKVERPENRRAINIIRGGKIDENQ